MWLIGTGSGKVGLPVVYQTGSVAEDNSRWGTKFKIETEFVGNFIRIHKKSMDVKSSERNRRYTTNVESE